MRMCFSQWRKSSPPRTARRRPGFTLVELLVVITIAFGLAAMSYPVLGAIVRDVRLGSAIARMKAGLQQTRALLSDYPIADRSMTVPAIPGAAYAGVALVARWDDVRQDYDLFYAISNQNAADSAGIYLASKTPSLKGYSRFLDLEPMTLGTGLRMAGLRRTANAGSDELELVPSPSFAICMEPSGSGIPPDQKIYANLQEAPPDNKPLPDGTTPWNTWDTAMYDASGSNTGAYAAFYDENGGKGEGFLTSLPMAIIYREDDLPLSGKSPSGNDWRKPNAGNVMVLNPAITPNELLTVTKGRVVLLTLQGGSPADY